MVTAFDEMTGFGVEGYSIGSPAIVLVSVDTSTKAAEDERSAADRWPAMPATAPTPSTELIMKLRRVAINPPL
jgi:hypothetical protein